MPSRYICLICRNPIPHAGAECPHCKARSGDAVGATPQLLALLFVAMVGLMLVTHRYNEAFHHEEERRSIEHYRTAKTLADYGYFEEAVENYRDALLYERENFEYRLGLALALYYLERDQEAQNQLLELRSQEPTDATTNRLLARLAARDNRIDEAANYYRAAVYGRWPRNPEENRLDTRFELIELLEVHGRPLQAVGELVSLYQEEPERLDLARRVARQFLELGSPGEAASVYANLLEQGQEDAEVLAGLGRARFMLRDFTQAERYLTRSLQFEPDEELRQLRDLCRDVIDLDPTIRGISAAARYDRSRRLLERTLAYVEYCHNPFGEEFVGPPSPLPSGAAAAMQLAGAALEVRERPTEPNQATEANLLLAENLWAVRTQVCVNIWREDEPLGLLMEALTQ